MYSGGQDYKYNSFFINRYIDSLSFYRKILARFFVKYKVTKQEYDKWFDEQMLEHDISLSTPLPEQPNQEK